MMKPVPIKSEKEKTPAEILAGIEWEVVDFEHTLVWFKSAYGITDMQVKVITLLLTKSLSDKFELAEDGVFEHGGQISFTIFINLENKFWDEYKGELEDYLKDPINLFDFGEKK